MGIITVFKDKWRHRKNIEVINYFWGEKGWVGGKWSYGEKLGSVSSEII